MSLLGRFLGSSKDRAYADGMALMEQGRFAEAAAQLRTVALGKSDTPSGSLASFHFRQALVSEGRRLLRARKFEQAIPILAEATRLWNSYPDLHCLHGAACGLADSWADALDSARLALRQNPDYTEARLLETEALRELGRQREAADSLNALLESGRRVEHWLIEALAQQQPYADTNLPEDLAELLVKALSGRSEKEEVAAAVALCRAGNWEEGLERFATLVIKRPRYPDYRTRHAAALFQLGRADEALAEVEAALALNETYRTAIDLKGLILAEGGEVSAAREFLAASDRMLEESKPGTAHEALFAAYLRGVLALLCGDPEAVAGLLEPWPDLVKGFARAELLRAAAEDVNAQSATTGRRLADLAAEWAAESIYFFLLACHHFEHRRYQDVAAVLVRWPAATEGQRDLRPLYLEGALAVCQGQLPSLPQPEEMTGHIERPAWDFLAARSAYLRGKDLSCWETCARLREAGHETERVQRLQTLAAAGAVAEVPGDWSPGAALPESCLAATVHYSFQRGDDGAAVGLVDSHQAVHPELLRAYWLAPSFWLDPVRGWIA